MSHAAPHHTVDDRPTPPAVFPTAGHATISVTLTKPDDLDEQTLRALTGRVDCLEVRADLLGDPDPRRIRRHFDGDLVYNLRSAGQGGAFTGGPDERRARLRAAAGHYDVLDLEEPDLSPDLLEAVPARQRRISWHGPSTDVPALHATLARLRATPARLYLVATATTRAEQALAPLLLLKESGQPDVTAFGTGTAGTWSRLLAPRLGAPVIYGRLDGTGDTGVPTVDQIVTDYGFPAMPALGALYGIIGGAVSRSMSPRLHNAGYRQRGLPALYLPFQVSDFAPFWRQVVEVGTVALGMPLRGATVVSPHKEAALRTATTLSQTARRSGSANSLVRSDRGWRADTSNSPAVLDALARADVSTTGRRVAVVGCGGAGRAAAAALHQSGARPTLVNRGTARGRYAAELLGLPFVPLADFDPAGFALVVHATPLNEVAPFPVDRLDEGATVLDMVYAPADTALVTAARSRGLTAIDGWDVLLADAGCQFRLMTGADMPVETTSALLSAARSARRHTAAVAALTEVATTAATTRQGR